MYKLTLGIEVAQFRQSRKVNKELPKQLLDFHILSIKQSTCYSLFKIRSVAIIIVFNELSVG